MSDPISNETHHYDGHLKELYKKYIDADTKVHPTFDQTLDLIFQDLKMLREKYPQFKEGSTLVLTCLKLLVDDKKGNYDDKNDIHVEQLLPRVWSNVKQFDDNGKFVFYEQIVDIIKSGPCAQGRTTRLIQFLF